MKMKIICRILFLMALNTAVYPQDGVTDTQDKQVSDYIVIPKKIAKEIVSLQGKMKDQISSKSAAGSLVRSLQNGQRSFKKDAVVQGLGELNDHIQALDGTSVDIDKENLATYLGNFKRAFTGFANTSEQLATGQPACFPSCAQNRVTSSVFSQSIAQLAITNGTASQNCNTGALTVAGGVGIKGNLNVCGTEHIFSTLASSDCAHGALVVNGGVGIQGNLNTCGPVAIADTTASTDCNTGALTVAGGVGIAGDLNVCGTLHIMNPNVSTGCSDGALIVDGGVGIGQDAIICGTVDILNYTNSTKCNNGALVVYGGVGIGKDLNVCGVEHIINETNSFACDEGALVVDGGVGIGGNLYVCGGLSVQGPINTSSCIGINGSTVVCTNVANCNLSIGDNTNPIANGTGNTAVGESAMQNNLVGSRDTALGCQPLKLDTAGYDDTALGFMALLNLNSGNENTAVGSASSYSMDAPIVAATIPIPIISGILGPLLRSTTVSETTAVGYQALYTNQKDSITAVGSYAIHDNTYARNLTAIGYHALEKVHSYDITYPYMGTNYEISAYGNDNTAVGLHALGLTPHGYTNVAVGVNALLGIAYNIAIPILPPPFNTIDAFPILYSNVAVGNQAIGNAYYAHDNTAVGHGAIGGQYGYGSYDQVAIGAGALGGQYQFINYSNCAVGNGAMSGPYLNASHTNTACGNNTLTCLSYGYNNAAIGNGSGNGMYYAYGNTSVGIDSFNSGSTYTYNVGPYTYTIAYCFGLIPPLPLVENTAVGWQALNTTYASYNTAVGSHAMHVTQAGFFNVAVGYDSLYYAYDECVTATGAFTYSDGAFNTLDGYYAYAVGAQNVVVGYPAYAIGDTAIAIGSEAYAIGDDDIAIGQLATAGPGVNCIAIGGEVDAGTGDDNIAIGQAIALNGGATCTGIGGEITFNAGVEDGIAIGQIIEMAAGVTNVSAIGGEITINAGVVGAVAHGTGIEATASAGNVVIGFGLAVNEAAGCVTIGSGLTTDIAVDCVNIGAAASPVGAFYTINLNSTVPVPTGVNLGRTFPANTTCFLGGVPPGALVVPTAVLYEVAGAVFRGTCNAICTSIPFEDEMDIIQDDAIRRSQIRKDEQLLMDLQPVHYSFRSNALEAIKRGEQVEVGVGVTVEQVERAAPDLIGASPDGDRYLLVDKVVMLLLRQIQIHQKTLQEYQDKFDEHEDEINELRKQNEMLKAAIDILISKQNN